MKLKPEPSLAVLAVVLTLAASLAFARAGSRPDAANAAEPIRVGVFLDFTGQTSSFGVAARDGIRMAADRINAAGGVGGRRVLLIFRDDEGRPDRAAAVVNALVNRERVHAVIGEVASANSLAAAPLAQEARVPMLVPASTNPKVTQVGDYIFRVCFADPFQGELLAKFAARTLKARRAAVLIDPDSDYSRGINETFTRAFTALGGRITLTQVYAQSDTDFTRQLAAIREDDPEVILVPGYYAQAGIIARQARKLGMRQPLLGDDGWDARQLWDLGGAALDGSYISNHYSLDDPSPSNVEFVAAFRGRYRREPDAIAALGYDAVGLLADAVRRAGSTDGAGLRAALARTRGYAGVTGTIDINAARDAVKPGVIFLLRGGEFVYHETVAPDSGVRD